MCSSVESQTVYPLSWSPPTGTSEPQTQPVTSKKQLLSSDSWHLSCKWLNVALSPASRSIWASLPGRWLLVSELQALNSFVSGWAISSAGKALSWVTQLALNLGSAKVLLPWSLTFPFLQSKKEQTNKNWLKLETTCSFEQASFSQLVMMWKQEGLPTDKPQNNCPKMLSCRALRCLGACA